MTLHRATTKVQALLYSLDHADLAGVLSSRKMAGVSSQIIMDAGRMRAPSCSQQLARLKSLLEWGVELRQWSLEAGQDACLHTKTFMIGEKTSFLGSTNATRNGLEHHEVVAHIEGSGPCGHFAGLFAQFWPLATPVDWPLLCASLKSSRR